MLTRFIHPLSMVYAQEITPVYMRWHFQGLERGTCNNLCMKTLEIIGMMHALKAKLVHISLVLLFVMT